MHAGGPTAPAGRGSPPAGGARQDGDADQFPGGASQDLARLWLAMAVAGIMAVSGGQGRGPRSVASRVRGAQSPQGSIPRGEPLSTSGFASHMLTAVRDAFHGRFSTERPFGGVRSRLDAWFPPYTSLRSDLRPWRAILSARRGRLRQFRWLGFRCHDDLGSAGEAGELGERRREDRIRRARRGPDRLEARRAVSMRAARLAGWPTGATPPIG